MTGKIVTRPSTKEYNEGWARIYGKVRSAPKSGTIPANAIKNAIKRTQERKTK